MQCFSSVVVCIVSLCLHLRHTINLYILSLTRRQDKHRKTHVTLTLVALNVRLHQRNKVSRARMTDVVTCLNWFKTCYTDELVKTSCFHKFNCVTCLNLFSQGQLFRSCKITNQEYSTYSGSTLNAEAGVH